MPRHGSGKNNRQRKEGGKWITRWRRLAIYMRDSFQCQYCGSDLRDSTPQEISLDHLICHCNGGSDHENNLVTACVKCNSQRGNKPWREYATGGAIARIKRVTRRRLNEDLARELTGQAKLNSDLYKIAGTKLRRR